MKWILKCFKQYADFKGRARRREFALFWLLTLLVPVVTAGIVFFWMGGDLIESRSVGSPYNAGFLRQYEAEIARKSTIVAFVCSMPFFMPLLAVAVRRLHDIGKSGWLLLIIPLVNVISLIGGRICNATDGITRIVVGVINIAISLINPICFLALVVIDSQSGTNKYGVSPKDVEAKGNGGDEGT